MYFFNKCYREALTFLNSNCMPIIYPTVDPSIQEDRLKYFCIKTILTLPFCKKKRQIFFKTCILKIITNIYVKNITTKDMCEFRNIYKKQ